MMKGLKHLACEEELRLFSLMKRMFEGGGISVYPMHLGAQRRCGILPKSNLDMGLGTLFWVSLLEVSSKLNHFVILFPLTSWHLSVISFCY